ncbi:MAG: hypothetical protein ABH864_05860 [archaeon]
MQKRGLSNIVSTVLVVLAAIIAVSIIWVMISPVFQRGGGEFQAQSKCYEVDVEPQKCLVYYGGGADGSDVVTVTVGVTAGVAEGLVASVEYGDATFESAQVTDTTVGTYETRLIDTI